jgi:Ala-tRNA(Pro) deacylase
MLVANIRDYLNERHARYITLSHSPAYTARETAASMHIPGRMIAKTVMVRLDGEMAMVVLPADRRIDLERLRNAAGAHAVRLASEEEFEGIFPECEVGAMPPLGDLYGLKVYSAPELTEADEIIFNAGTHTDAIKLPYAEFKRLARPTVADLCVRPSSATAAGW